MDLLFFWGIKLWGMGALKTLFYVFLIIAIIDRIFATIGNFRAMDEGYSPGIIGFFKGIWGDYVTGLGGGRNINYINPFSSLILLIGYIAILLIFPHFDYPISAIFWTFGILHFSVAILSIIGFFIGQISFNGIVFAIMDIIAIINLNSILV